MCTICVLGHVRVMWWIQQNTATYSFASSDGNHVDSCQDVTQCAVCSQEHTVYMGVYDYAFNVEIENIDP